MELVPDQPDSPIANPKDQACSEEESKVWDLLADVLDPEVPALSVVDLGIIRKVTVDDAGFVTVAVTPTYTGCPATDMINAIIKAALHDGGYEDASIETVLSPAWTTDWISEDARSKLKEYGIAPPVGAAPTGKAALLGISPEVLCPRCGSKSTERISEFGSTACKAMYRCEACLEPFEYFKCI
tara:strand:- start:23847 stop:24398 length:552 start_codon:yes stop_codon:yes gene_type:complete